MLFGLAPQRLVENVMCLGFAVSEGFCDKSGQGLLGRFAVPDHVTDLIPLMKRRDASIENVQTGGKHLRSDLRGPITLLWHPPSLAVREWQSTDALQRAPSRRSGILSVVRMSHGHGRADV